MATAYVADGATKRTSFPSGLGGGYTALDLYTDQYTLPSGTSAIINDTIQMFSIPAGYTVFDMWLDISTDVAGTCEVNVGSSGTANLFMDGIDASAAVTGRLGDGSAPGGFLWTASSATDVYIKLISATTPSDKEVVFTLHALVGNTLGE